MAFNLKKFATNVPEMDASQSVLTGLERAEDTFEPQESVQIDDSQVLDSADNTEQESLLNQAKNLPLINQLEELLAMPDYAEIAPVVKEQPEVKALLQADDLTALRARIDQLELGPTVQQFEKSNDRMVRPDELKNYLDRIKTTVETQQREQAARQQQQLRPAASKRAQVSAPDPVDESGKGLFIQQYLEILLAFRGDKGRQDAAAEEAKQEILAAVSPMLQNDANDALEAIQALNPHERERAEHFLALVFENFVAPAALETTQMEQPVMSKHNPKGIIKFNLSDHILNNAENQEKMTKTARMHSDDAYLLYGPTEKRICPKLRGKGVGDVVSEYICRHHCLDGIVIDDNKTICGEALWRANAMDKFSREYVDEDGDIKGGYINKRFEINRNVPEENKMRLKPGETRKPRPASIYGNMEARMQEMRQKEGQDRGYAPDTDTSEPFGWCHDVDQNNVEQTQETRDRREENSGHDTAPGQGPENKPKKPKKGFNLKNHKVAEKCPCGCGESKDECNCHEDPDKGKSYSAYINDKNREQNWSDKKAAVENDKVVKVQVSEFKEEEPKQTCSTCVDVRKSFNLKQHKEATGCNVPITDDGSPIEPKEKKIKEDDDISREDLQDEQKKKSFNLKSHKEAKSPPGFKTTVEKMEEDHSDEIDNPFALAWWMKNEGHESHYNDKTKKKKEKFKDEDKDDKKESSSDRTFAEAYKDAYVSEEFCGGVAPQGYVGSSKKKT